MPKPDTLAGKEQPEQPEQEARRLKERSARVHKAGEVVKSAALAYVGLRLGLEAVRFLGRAFHGKRREANLPAPQGAAGRRSASGVLQASDVAGAGATHHTAGAGASEDSWSVIDAAPPPTPPDYKPIAQAVLPCSPQELYGILFSGSGSELYLQQHREIGKHWDLHVTSWRRAEAAAAASGSGGGAAGAVVPGAPGPDGSLLGPLSVFEYVVGQPGSGGFTRLLTFWNPKKPPSSNDTRCVQRQQLAVYRGGVLLFATAMNMLDIPFRDCFTVNTLWRVAPGAAPGTASVSVCLRVQFLKRAMGVGSIISATTSRETAAFFAAFLANVERHLTTLRQQAGAHLPAPLPAGAARGPLGGPSLTCMQSPFAAAAGTPLPPAHVHAHAHGGGAARPGGAVAPLRQTLPLWKQLRALLVFVLLVGLLLHQLQLSRQLASLRSAAAAAGLDLAAGDAAAAAEAEAAWPAAAAEAKELASRAAAAAATALGHGAVAAAAGMRVGLGALMARVWA